MENGLNPKALKSTKRRDIPDTEDIEIESNFQSFEVDCDFPVIIWNTMVPLFADRVDYTSSPSVFCKKVHTF